MGRMVDAQTRRRRIAGRTFVGLIGVMLVCHVYQGLAPRPDDKYKHLTEPGLKYLYYFEELEYNGLNNQRQELRTMLALAEELKRILILPIFHSHHKMESPVLLGYFFDRRAFEENFPQVLPHRYLSNLFPDWQKLPVQYIDIGTVPKPPETAPYQGRLKRYEAKAYHLGASEREVLSWFGSNEDPLLVFYSGFRRFGQFSSRERQQRFDQRVFRGLILPPKTLTIQELVVLKTKAVSPNLRFNCLHLRRGDTFLTEHAAYEKPLQDLVLLTQHYLENSTSLYIATDTPTSEVRKLFLAAGYPTVHFLADHFPDWATSYVRTPDDKITMRWGQIDQAVCAEGEKFLGNIWSSFTCHISFVRRMSGRPQVCQDIYGREQPEGMPFI